jgi:hypothetical protein
LTFHDLPLGEIVLTYLPLQGKIEVTFLGEIEGGAYLAKTKSHTESTESTEYLFLNTDYTDYTDS